MPQEPSKDTNRRAVRIGKYEVISHLATGGMGAVYKAWDTESERPVALKVLSQDNAAKPTILERFRREARSAARLNHENIVAVYEFGEANDTHFLAMEFVDGIDLYEHLRRKGKLDPEEARLLLIQAARALQHAYEQGIVHRDIKPANFLLTEKEGKPFLKMTDMGLARGVHDEDARLTRLGSTVGTADYISPEQARDSGTADIRSDIYSLGCSLFHLLAGHPPFYEGSLTDRIIKHLNEKAPDIRKFNPAVQRRLAKVLRRMLKKKPEERFQNPNELIQALEWAAAQPPSAEIGRANLLPSQESGSAGASPSQKGPDVPQTMIEATRATVFASGETTSEPGAVMAEFVGFSGPALPAAPVAVIKADPAPQIALGKSTRAPAAPQVPTLEKPRDGNRKKRRSKKKRRTSGVALLGLCLSLAIGGTFALLIWHQNMNQVEEPFDDPQTVQNKIQGDVLPKPPEPQPPPVNGKTPDPMGKPDPIKPKTIPPVFAPKIKIDPQQLFQEFAGPHGNPAAPPQDAVVLSVSRAKADAKHFSSLAEAFAEIVRGKTNIIEIYDNGPIFSGTLPQIEKSDLIIRGGQGFRPLIAWEIPPPEKFKENQAFLSVWEGNLTLENVDVVVKWPELDPFKQPFLAQKQPIMVQVAYGHASFKDCTFSAVGNPSKGVVAIHLQGGSVAHRCQLAECYLRGPQLTALVVDHPNADILVRDSLLVGTGEQPLIQAQSNADGPTLRLIRSTLVAGKTLMSVQVDRMSDGTLGFNGQCCDCLLAQADPLAESSLLSIHGGNPSKVNWKAVNCLYAGWKHVLEAPGKTILGKELSSWRQHWDYAEGDQYLAAIWPTLPPSNPHLLAATNYNPGNTTAEFAALSAPGLIGCDVSKVPPGRPNWLSLTYEPFPLPLISFPTETDLPNSGNGGSYTEKIDLQPGMDLGKEIQSRLDRTASGARMVFVITGSGEHQTSSLHIKNREVVLHFEKPPGTTQPLELVPDSTTTAGQEALVHVANGNLLLSGARIVSPSSDFTPAPKRVIQVQNGHLALYRCHLSGPFHISPENYSSLIEFGGSGKETLGTVPTCKIAQSVLLSAKNVLSFPGKGIRFFMKQSLVASSGDALSFDLGEVKNHTRVLGFLENNTFALCHSLLKLKGETASSSPQPMVLVAKANLFLAPFHSSLNKANLLHCPAEVLSNGLLVWQEQGNAFDQKHLRGYAVHTANLPRAPSRDGWQKTWGSANCQEAFLLDLPDLKLPLKGTPLHLLGIPKGTAGLGLARPGANLVELGIQK